ncbi:MAG: hypothetical protein HZC45_06760 [Deltaproteobacteria bacterium]|nr:hypothetical protein [Deltaproteobacteria bacterium]
MIKTQVIKEENKPIAVILDYREYIKLKEIEEDRIDYYSAIETKLKNKKWVGHKDLKKKLNL